MRKISKAFLYPPGGDQQDGRPRGVSGATITAAHRPLEIDLATLFTRPADQVTIAGAAASAPVSPDAKPATKSPDDAPVTFVTPGQFPIIATV